MGFGGNRPAYPGSAVRPIDTRSRRSRMVISHFPSRPSPLFGGRRRTARAMDDAIRKAEALIEACSYIRTFRDKLTVIKLGGSAMEDPAALEATLQDVVFMETVGMRPVLVHGGRKPIDRAMDAAGIKPRKVLGRRYTEE